ncbi:MAG: hypothetical protein AB1657_03450 [Candidatus Micrarchaeota archaeon]
MSRSVFILASGKPAVTSAQLRRVRDEFRDQGLRLEGPYSDRKDALGEIVNNVRQRLKLSPHDELTATLLTLAPQNLPAGFSMGEASWLRVPFILAVRKGPDVDEKQTAGEVASSEPIRHNDSLARITDSQEITMLTVSVLRRLGIESFYAVAHLSREFFGQAIAAAGIPANVVGQSGTFAFQEPCVLIPQGSGAKIMRFAPPGILGLDGSHPITAVEVLDGDALRSLLVLKRAASEARNLMNNVGSRSEEFVNEGGVRAAAIGHAIHEGSRLWTPDCAHAGIDTARSIINPSESPAVESVRESAEREYVHQITCRACHTLWAATTLLCDNAKAVMLILSSMAHENAWMESGPQGLLGKVIEGLAGHRSCVQRFDAYMGLARDMNGHIHPASECERAEFVN